jgi:hypothetical protein
MLLNEDSKHELQIPLTERSALQQVLRDHVTAEAVNWPEGVERTTERFPGTAWGGPAEPRPSRVCERWETTQLPAQPLPWSAPAGRSGKLSYWEQPAATGILRARPQYSTHRSGWLAQWSTARAWQCRDLPARSSMPFFYRRNSRVSCGLDATIDLTDNTPPAPGLR